LTLGMPTRWFRTAFGTRIPAVTADQMRLIDKIAVDGPGPNLFQMMENAGRNLTEMISAATPSAVVILAGTGGNGGGGICAARHLVNHGFDVKLVISNSTRLTGVPRQQLELFLETGTDLCTVAELPSHPDLVVDAIIGYGLRNAPRAQAAEMIEWVNRQQTRVVSLDVPSGMNATSGEAPGIHVSADETMTLALPKTGLDAGSAGKLRLADIGIPVGVYQKAGVAVPEGIFESGYVIDLVAEP